MSWKLFSVRWDELEIKINYFLGEHMLVCRAASFIYLNKGSELAKSFFKSVDCIDPFDLQVNNRIGEAFLGGC